MGGGEGVVGGGIPRSVKPMSGAGSLLDLDQ